MKNKKKKILTLILITFILLFCLGAKSYAFGIDDAIDGIVGVLLLPAKFLPLIIGGIIEIILGFFTNIDNAGLTLEDILFNKVPLIDINFFDYTTTNDVALTIRENIAIWYTSIRNIAAVVLAIIAVYVGIRMAISTIAEDKAKYKTMLYDWLTSLALLFVMQYIMIFTININNAFIDVLSTGLSDAWFGSMTDQFLTQSFLTASFTEGMGCALIYMMLQSITFVFLLTYIKRMITLAFLIVISPLVTITYSIDKMGDGKSQALNVWLKEYVYNILIQPFHCISYRVLAESAIKLTSEHGFAEGAGLANAVIAIMIMLFIYTSEEIVKHIFHFESQSMGKTVANAAIGGLVLNKVMSGKKESGGGGGSKSKGNSSSNNSRGQNQNNRQNGSQSGSRNGGQNSDQSNNPNSRRSSDSGHSSGSDSSDTRGSSGSQNTNSIGSVVKKSAATVGKGALKVASTIWGKNPVLPSIAGAMVFGGLGLGLGDAKTGFAGMMAGASMGSNLRKANQNRIMKHQLARAVNKYKDENPDITQEELVNNALHLKDGSIEPQTEAEEELAKIMQSMEQSFIDNGIDEKKIPKQFKRLISDIEDGRISEYSTFQRFTGNIFTDRNNINRHNYNNNSNSNNTNNGDNNNRGSNSNRNNIRINIDRNNNNSGNNRNNGRGSNNNSGNRNNGSGSNNNSGNRNNGRGSNNNSGNGNNGSGRNNSGNGNNGSGNNNSGNGNNGSDNNSGIGDNNGDNNS